MPTLPHFRWPLSFATRPDGSVGFDLVEQDTDDDLRSSAALIATVPRGARPDDPSFGVTTPVFEQGPVDVDRLAGEIAQSDDRLTLDIVEDLDLAAPTRRTLQTRVGRTT